MTATLQSSGTHFSHPAKRPAEDADRKSPIRKFRPDIEGLRAIAVISVVMSHAGLLAFTGGYVGVDVFFVISGFLITRQLYNEIERTHSLSFTGFYARRARRILPAATLVIVSTLLAVHRWGPPLRMRSIAVDGLFSSFSGVNWRLAAARTNYFNDTVPPSPFQHYWSLAVEEQFYVVWPLLLLVIGVFAARRFGRRNSLVWALLAIIVVSLTLSVTTTSGANSWAYFGTQTRAWELAIGAMLAITVDLWTKMRPALACQLSWVGIGMIVTSIFVYTASTTYPGVAVVLPVMGSAFVIAGGCPGWRKGAEIALKQRPMQWAGQFSYSWYLWHWPVLMVLPMALGHGLSTSEKYGAVAGSLALSVATYYLVEQPFRTRTFMVAVPWRSLGIGAVLVAGSVTVALLITVNSIAVRPIKRVAAPTKAVALSALQKDIRAGAALQTLPRNITPTLAQAIYDHPTAGAKCFVTYAATQPPALKTCTFGDRAAARSLLLVGDSHANSWFDVINQYATKNHYRLFYYAKANCNAGIYLNQVISQLKRAYSECDVWRDRIFALSEQQIKPNYVIMSSAIRAVSVDPSGTVQAVRRYETQGAKVVFMEDTPKPTPVGSVPDCLSKHTTDVQKCTIVRPTASQLENLARTAENRAVVTAGAATINPTPWYCTDKVCPAIIHNLLVYQDESHTTATYAGWVAPEYDLALTKALTT